MSELPQGWIEVEIGELATVIAGGTPKASDPSNFEKPGKGIAWLTPADLSKYTNKTISNGSRDLSQKGLDSSSAKLLPKGSVLFSSRAPIGYVAIAANDIATNQGFKNFVFSEEVNSSYAYYYLKSIRSLAESWGTGTTFKELSGAVSKKLPFVLAPLNEQIRIANKLDQLLTKVDVAKTRLNKIPTILKRFRQSVLAAATSGDLTVEWRGKEEWRGKDLDWEMVELKDVGREFNYGTSSKSQKEGKVPVLRMGNLQGGELDWTSLVYTSDPKEIEKYRLDDGDVLFNRTNSPELVGKTSIYHGERQAIFAGYLIRVKCGEKLNAEFLNIQLNSPDARDYCWRVKTDGVSQSNINAKKLQAYKFLLPSINEQIEIVRRVNSLFSILESLDKQYQSTNNRVNKIAQSLLSKAFRGELFHQDPNDESANKLLERVRTKREKKIALLKTKPKRETTKKVQANTAPKTVKKAIVKKSNKNKAGASRSSVCNNKQAQTAISGRANEVLELARKNFADEPFTVAQLNKAIGWGYEELKEALFDLIKGDLQEGLKPMLKMQWDGEYQLTVAGK